MAFVLHKASVVDEGLLVRERFGKQMPKGMTFGGVGSQAEGFLSNRAGAGRETIRLYPGHPSILAIMVQTKKAGKKQKKQMPKA